MLSIQVSPSNLTIGESGKAEFIAIARGAVNMKNFTYQWRKRGSNSLPGKASGANGTTLSIPNLSEYDEGRYYCIVTNEWSNNKTSNDVILMVKGT